LYIDWHQLKESIRGAVAETESPFVDALDCVDARYTIIFDDCIII